MITEARIACPEVARKQKKNSITWNERAAQFEVEAAVAFGYVEFLKSKTPQPLGFDEIMRRALTIKPTKPKKVSKPVGQKAKPTK